MIWWEREVCLPAPYSNDLRNRVVDAYLGGHGSYAEIGDRFDVGEATVDRWVGRFRRANSVAPDPMGGDRHSKFSAADEQTLRQLVADDPDITRDELVRALAGGGLQVSTAAVQRALERNGLTRKKRRSTLLNGTPRA